MSTNRPQPSLPFGGGPKRAANTHGISPDWSAGGANSIGVSAGGYRETTLTRLCGDLTRTFTDIGPILVQGEVHNARPRDGRLMFFTLRDRSFEIPVFVPSNRAKFCMCKDGDRVAIAGKLELSRGKVQVQLAAHEVSPVGEGAIAARIEQTRLRLESEGLTGRPRKPLPFLPRLVGVVCGSDAAVRKDIESVVLDRFPGYPVIFEEVTVQGVGAVDGITFGIEALVAKKVDVIILARGGGDSTQLLPFSDESVCRLIARCSVPVVSAIGHDGDRPLSDDVADRRAGTPSIAAQMVIPSRVNLTAAYTQPFERVDRAHRLREQRCAQQLGAVSWEDALQRRVEREGHRLARVDFKSVLHQRITRAEHRLAGVDWKRPVEISLRQAESKLLGTWQRIDALSPQRVFERGYAAIRSENGMVVRDAALVRPHQRIHITVANGTIDALIEAVHPDGHSPSSHPTVPLKELRMNTQSEPNLSSPTLSSSSPAAARDVHTMTFEELVSELEATAQTMDSGTIGIEEATALYGRAAELHRAASNRLTEVTSRIQALRDTPEQRS